MLHSCDQQSEERIQKKNRAVVRHVQDMHDYKETLLSFIAHSKIALVYPTYPSMNLFGISTHLKKLPYYHFFLRLEFSISEDFLDSIRRCSNPRRFIV